MKRNGRLWTAAGAVAWLWAFPSLAGDGTWKGASSSDYGTTNNWLGGVVAGGAGATLWSYTDRSLTLPAPGAASATNIVLGSLVVPEDAPAIAGLTVDPGFGAYGRTQSLTFDSGAAGAPAALLNNCVTNTTRVKIRSDIRLRSDLLVAYNPTNWVKSPHTAVYLTGDISEEGARRGLVVSNGTPQNQVALFGNNTFSGDIEVRQGGLRAQSYTRLGGEGRQFGHDNTIVVTNANAQLDLGGFSFGADQRLVIAGCGVGGLGALAASQQSPCYTSVWSGPVTLAGDAAVGMGYCSYYPRKVGGALALAGPVGEQGGARALIKNSPNTLFLRGTNTYSGGTVVSNGYLSASCKENLGTGPLVLAGGAFLFETPWDFTSAGVVLTNRSSDIRLRVPGQNVTFNGVLGPFAGSVFKSGLGSLTLTRTGLHQNLLICSGAVNLDYTTRAEAKLPSAWYVNLYNNASLNIVGGAQPFTNAVHSLNPQAGCAGVVSISGAAGTRFNLEGSTSCSIGTGAALDLRIQSGTALDLPRASYDGSGIMLSSRMTCNGGSAFATKVAWNDGTVIPFAAAATNWDSATPRHMDVTALTPATAPADAMIRTLRFNDPSAGQLTLQGNTGLTNGAILVTAQMGTTPVHIQGGTLTSAQSSELIVHQYNTQAVLRISSVLTNTPAGGSLVLTKTGPGTLILSDVPNTFSGNIYVLGGTLEIESQQAFGATNRLVYVYNGSTVRLHNGMVVGAYNQHCFQCNEAGGRIDVPAGESATSLARVDMQSHGLLTKTGKGTLRLVGDWTQQANEPCLAIQTWNYTVEDGTLDIGDSSSVGPRGLSGECQVKVTVKNGAVLRGNGFLFGCGTTNGGGSSEDEAGSYHLYVDETGGTVDLHGVSVNLGRLGVETYSCDFISGPGRLTVTNTSGTAATFSFSGAHLSRLTGALDGARYFVKNIGGGVPNGEFPVPEGVSVDFGWESFPYTIAIGRLTGSGAFGGKCPDAQSQPPLLVGRDASETFEYAGYLWGTYNGIGNSAFPFRYTKVGSDAWRISGTTNAMTSDVTVRCGQILVGANSPGQGAVGALGKARVLMGDECSKAGDRPALLTDGPYTVGNALVLTNTDPAVTVTLGGSQTSGASLFTSALNLTRDVVLTAANTDANGVTFSGAVTGPGGITKTGAGTVYLTGAVSNAGPVAVQAGTLVMTGGTAFTNTLTVSVLPSGSAALAVNGNLVLGTGAALALAVTGTLDRGQTYTLATWSGSRSGTFTSVAGLPENWHVGFRSNSLALYYAVPGTLIRLL